MNSYKIPHIEWPRLKTLSSSALRTGDALKCATPSLVNLQLTRPVSQEVALIALTLGCGFTAQTHPKLVAMKQGWLTEHPGRNSRNGCVMSCGYIKKCRNSREVNKCVEIAFCSKSLLRKMTKAQYLECIQEACGVPKEQAPFCFLFQTKFKEKRAPYGTSPQAFLNTFNQYLYQWQSPSITSQIWCHVLTLAFDLLTIPCKNLELVRSLSVGVAHPHPERPFDFINQFWSASKGSCAGRGVSKSETVQKTETEALEVKPLSEDNQAATRKTGNKKGQQPICSMMTCDDDDMHKITDSQKALLLALAVKTILCYTFCKSHDLLVDSVTGSCVLGSSPVRICTHHSHSLLSLPKSSTS